MLEESLEKSREAYQVYDGAQHQRVRQTWLLEEHCHICGHNTDRGYTSFLLQGRPWGFNLQGEAINANLPKSASSSN
jgi:hypothetical protein